MTRTPHTTVEPSTTTPATGDPRATTPATGDPGATTPATGDPGATTPATGDPGATTGPDATALATAADPSGPHRASRPDPVLQATGLAVGYDRRAVLRDLDLSIERGTVTTFLGANGCGKSTLLKAFGRVLTPSAGRVLLDGEPIAKANGRAVARKLAILPQSPVAPPGTSVLDLVMRGRNPHQSWARPWTEADAEVAERAIAATGLTEVAHRDVASLSGGQRQRAWIALVVAQEADTLLLDEPTTYLDLAHQLEVLRLVRRLNRERGATVVMVLHDLSLAARYSDRLVVLHDGGVVADGTPDEVLTPAVLDLAFGLHARVVADPVTGTPMVVPEADDHQPVPADER